MHSATAGLSHCHCDCRDSDGRRCREQDLTWKSFFSAMVSTFTINLCISTYRGDYGGINDPGLLSFGAFVSNPYTYAAPFPPCPARRCIA